MMRVSWDSGPWRYFFSHALFWHRWLFLQSLFLMHSTHVLSSHSSSDGQSLSFLHSTHLSLSQTSSPSQSLSFLHFLANAGSVNSESPTRPSAPAATALSMPRRRDDVP